jgi:hypothetical protein
MNQGTQGYSLTKKTEGRKSRDTVSLSSPGEIVEADFLLLMKPPFTTFYYNVCLFIAGAEVFPSKES